MIATNNIVARVAAVVAGLSLVAASFAVFTPAKAQTTAELETQIQALLAQIAAMQGGSTTATASVTFTRDLTIGSSGADVTALQNWLIKGGYAIPAGATGYFGAQTQSALAKYQAAAGITPAAGYFGPVTRAKVNAGAGTGTGTGTGTGSNTGGLSGGEASLEDLQARDGEDDEVEEGGSAQVAEFEFDVEDGDVRIDRLDLTFEAAGGNDEDEPWETFDTITILNGEGDELASEDVSDEDEWLDEDDGVFRFTDLDYVVDEGEQAVLIVEVEAQNGIDGINNGESWTVFIDEDGVRGTDGEGIEQYIGDDTETVTFDVEEEGSNDDLSVRSSTEDPESTTLRVEDDGRSDWYTIFAFDLDSDDESNEIELNDIGINFTTSDDKVTDVVNDVKLVIDGEEFDDFDWGGVANATYASTTFDIDGDATIDGGDRVTVEVMVEFKASTGYATSTTIQASTTGALIDAEGADDVTVDGSAQGDVHTLVAEGINVQATDDSAVTTVVDGSNNDYATFELDVEVTAIEEDIFISRNAGTAFTYRIEDGNGNVIGSSTATSSSISSTADTEGNYYRVSDGDTETFTFQVVFNPEVAVQGRFFRAQILTIAFNDEAAAPDQTYTAVPESDFETASTVIND